MNDRILEKINTGVATVLSAIYPGLGQFYNEELLKSFAFIIIGVILLYFAFLFINVYSNDLYFIIGSPSYDSSIFIVFIYVGFWIFSILYANTNYYFINLAF